MNRSEIVHALNESERKFSVGSWTIEGLDIWPVIKVNLFFYNFYKYCDTSKGNPTRQHQSLFGKLSKIVSGFLTFKFTRFRSSDVLYSEAVSHYGKLGGQVVSKFFFPIEKYLVDKSDGKINFSRTLYGGRIARQTYKENEIIDIEKLALPFHFLKKVKQIVGFNNKKQSRLSQLKEVFEYLQISRLAPCNTLQEFENYIERLYQKIDAYRIIYRKILKQAKPQVILEVCYYTEQNYALNVEARTLKVPTIELMHGGIGDLHIAYMGWEHSIRKEGYNTLPQSIWLWDNETESQLNSWVSTQQYHKVFVAGNPWLDYIAHERENLYLDAPLFTEKKKVLYTLQFDSVDDYICEAIKKSTEDYEWWLRTHPRKQYAKENILKKLELWGIVHKVNIEEANELPLPVILKYCTVHISEYSGSIIEAALLEKPSVILSKIGADSYRSYVNSGICVVSLEQSSEDLLRKIKSVENIKANFQQVKKDYSDIFVNII